MKKLISAYENALWNECAKNTVQSYMIDLEKFLKECNVKTKKDLLKIKADTVNDYIQNRKNLGVSYSSVLRSVASLKKFFGYAFEAGITKRNPAEGINMPKPQRKMPITMTDEEVVDLLEAPDKATLKGIRDSAMLELMYATGARVSEIVGLKTGDVVLKNEVVILQTGKKSRYVPIGSVAIDALYKYIKDCRGEIATEKSGDSFFLNLYGEPMSRQGFWKIVKGYIEKCGLNPGITPQSLRHSFALHMLRNGADARAVSEMLGYSDVSSTKIYMDVLNNRIRDIYKSSHPRA
ncbi:MAG: tyrosine recombinase [Clostridia bacterium]|nr:tyrosine recombinase [Clostridia bacterium]